MTSVREGQHAAAAGEDHADARLTLQTAAVELGINLERDTDLVDVAQDLASPSSLPQGWNVYLDKASKRRFYNNQSTGESVWEHPLVGYYQGEIFMRRGGRDLLEEASRKHPCTEDEIDDMAEYLEIAASDSAEVRDVARMAINAPLPPGWEDVSDEATGEAAFRNAETEEVVDQHPLDDYFFELVRRRRAADLQEKRRVTLNSREAIASRERAQDAPAENGTAQREATPEHQRLSDSAAVAAEPGTQGGGRKGLLSTSEKDEIKHSARESAKALHNQTFAEETDRAQGQLQGEQAAPRVSTTPPDLHDSLDDLEARLGQLGIHHSQSQPEAQQGNDTTSNSDGRSQAVARASRRGSVYDTSAAGGDEGAAVSAVQSSPPPAGGWGRSSLLSPAKGGEASPTEAAFKAALQEDYESLEADVRASPLAERSGNRRSSYSQESRGNTKLHSANGESKSAEGPGPDSGAEEADSEHGHALLNSTGRQENIRVCVRARPLKRREKTVWQVDRSGRSIKLKEGANVKRAAAFYADSEHKLQVFQYSSVFEEDDTTRAIYESTVKDIVHGTLDGYNGTVFAYGQTGSGKTHTIVGNRKDPGVLILAVEELFSEVEKLRRSQSERAYSFRVGVLEIYNEDMRDLGAPGQTQRLHQGELSHRLQIKEDPILGVKVAGLHEEVVDSIGRVKVLLDRGMSRRQTAATKMNDASSRSHTIFRIIIECKQSNFPMRVSTLNFVDLAGSERLEKTENTGARAGESAYINTSLLMLGNVISKLAEGRGMEHIPFRNSKLTRILQPSLGGNARTAVIAAVNPASSHADETSHTLRFASRAMNIVNTIQVNEVLTDAEVIKRYKAQVADLTKKLRQVEVADSFKELRHLRRKCVRLEEENEHLTRKLEYVSNNAAVLGEVGGTPPRTPPDLNLPTLQPRRGAAQVNDAQKALSSIARVANLGRARGGENAQQSPEAVVQAVRVMRAERDELRKRDTAHRQSEVRMQEKMEDHSAIVAELRVVEDATAILEDLVGGSNLNVSLSERLKEAVEASAIIAAEMSSMQRQHATIAIMLRQEEARSGELEAVLTEQRGRVDRMDELEKNNFVLKEEKLRALSQRDDFARQLGKDPTKLFPPGGNTLLPGEQALKYAGVLEKRMKVFEDLAQQRERERDTLKQELAAWAALPPSQTSKDGVSDEQPQVAVVGSAAVRAARLAARDALAFRKRAEEAEEGQKSLQHRVGELESQLGELARTNSDKAEVTSEDDDSVVIERMKKRVYALSREVASLTRERDDLLMRLMDNSYSSQDAQVWSMQSIPEAEGISFGMAQTPQIRGANGGPSTAEPSGSHLRPSAVPGSYSAPPQPQQGYLLPTVAAQQRQQQQQYQQQPPAQAAWEEPGGGRDRNGRRGKRSPEKRRSKPDFDNRPIVPDAVKIQQKYEDRALRDPYYGRTPVLEEIALPPPGQQGRRLRADSGRGHRPVVRQSLEGSETLRLRQRLVAAERARSEAVSRANEEKRALEQRLANWEKAAISGTGVDQVVRQKEMEAMEKAQIAEQFRIERDEMAAAMQRIADENAKLKAGLAEWQFYKTGLGK